jgi:hypothetical protein
MNAYASPSDHFSRRVEEFFENARSEIRDAVTYIDREIVPEVRREAGTAARILARHLDQLADRLHPQTEYENVRHDGKQGL